MYILEKKLSNTYFELIFQLPIKFQVHWVLGLLQTANLKTLVTIE